MMQPARCRRNPNLKGMSVLLSCEVEIQRYCKPELKPQMIPRSLSKDLKLDMLIHEFESLQPGDEEFFSGSFKESKIRKNTSQASWTVCLLNVVSCGMGTSCFPSSQRTFTCFLGVGIIAMPYMLSQAGLFQGLAMMLGVGFLNGLSLYFLTVCSDALKVRSYLGMANSDCYIHLLTQID
jgi:hypothetical protein